MNLKLISALAAGLLMSAPTFAANVTIDFEGTAPYGSIGDFYNGGAGGNYGITFGGDAQALDAYEVDVNFPLFNDPALGGRIMAPVGLIENGVGTSSSTMNVAGGFDGQISLQYASNAATSVRVYSGLDGTGSLLGAFDLLQTLDGSCTSSALCMWATASLDFAGVAHSVVFGDAFGADGTIATFDNISINAVPLPAAAWLLISGLGGLGVFSRRKRAA